MKLPSFTIVAVLLVACTLPADLCNAGEFYSSRARSRTDCKLPKYKYSQNSWPFTTPSKFGATVIAVAATDPTNTARKIKPFHFRATSLTVDHIVLDDVGLALYENGKLFASGRITNTGGDGGVIGNNVTVRIRAYASHTNVASPVIAAVPGAPLVPAVAGEEGEIPIATPNEVSRIPPDAYRVWSSEIKFWVSRGRPQRVSLVETVDRHKDLVVLRRHFEEITHLEVELEYQRDR